mmetsp:Transcript_43299/g.101086  ORF Transcript_43299/g.101086 Transcript_43299/m.101086 type:complete len:245 (+) Transcript_43299:233-967(+)
MVSHSSWATSFSLAPILKQTSTACAKRRQPSASGQRRLPATQPMISSTMAATTVPPANLAIDSLMALVKASEFRRLGSWTFTRIVPVALNAAPIAATAAAPLAPPAAEPVPAPIPVPSPTPRPMPRARPVPTPTPTPMPVATFFSSWVGSSPSTGGVGGTTPQVSHVQESSSAQSRQLQKSLFWYSIGKLHDVPGHVYCSEPGATCSDSSGNDIETVVNCTTKMGGRPLLKFSTGPQKLKVSSA